jgi:hypothetical protein
MCIAALLEDRSAANLCRRLPGVSVAKTRRARSISLPTIPSKLPFSSDDFDIRRQFFYISMTSHTLVHTEKRRRLDRVTAACDLCKRRKVKCDGVRLIIAFFEALCATFVLPMWCCGSSVK